MDETLFMIPFSQGFQMPHAPLLHKTRYLEENLDAMNPHCNQSFKSSIAKSAGSFDGFEQLFEISEASFNVEGTASSSSPFPPPTLLLKLDYSTGIPFELSNVIPNNRNISKTKPERYVRHVIKTRSESNILDDGYKWRKYGNKFIKGNPNPRNYYKCSYRSCNVKKMVQRDAQDKAIVITTYEGRHNHESSTAVYYTTNPPLFAAEQDAPPLSYPSYTPTDFVSINNI